MKAGRSRVCTTDDNSSVGNGIVVRKPDLRSCSNDRKITLAARDFVEL